MMRTAILTLRATPYLLLLYPVACTLERAETAEQDATAAPSPARAAPTTREGFLSELAPLPADTLIVVYRVSGPAGLSGTMELLARRGGYRRENWVVRLAPSSDEELIPPNDQPRDAPQIDAPGHTVEVRSANIRTPEMVWSGREGRPGLRQAAPWGDLALAYLQLGPNAQGRVTATLRRWHADLETGRRESPGENDRVLDTDCTVIRSTGRSMCLWESAGIVLRHTSPELSLEATSIQRDVELGEHAFDRPRESELPSHLTVTSSSSSSSSSPSVPSFDAPDILRRLAQGRYGAVATLLAGGSPLPALAGRAHPSTN
ncbi:MAG: hypothetical protein V3V08_21720 [Nannocystaceae bacterium]